MTKQSPAQNGVAYDYIIVGAGSAGCVLAYRLTENLQNKVLLIEAGSSDGNPFVWIPKGVGKIRTNPNLLWSFPVEPENGVNTPEVWIRGKMLGGTSSVNGMLYMRGQPETYDEWESLGNPGWGWKDMSRVYAEMETYDTGGTIPSQSKGPLRVSAFPSGEPICDAMIAAGQAIGLTRGDLNTPGQCNIEYAPRTIYRGRRESAASAFLRRATRRPNLRIVTGMLAENITFDGKRATGIICKNLHGEKETFTGREILLCTGAIHSPKLLQLSGIGPAHHLRNLGIDVLHDSPGVGGNMREHRMITMQFRMKTKGSYNQKLSGLGLLGSVATYLLFRKGPLASPIYDVGAQIRTVSESGAPDAQLWMAPFSLESSRSGKYKLEDKPGLQCIGFPLRPESMGSVMVRSADPADTPVIRPNYLTAEYDRHVSIALFRFMRSFFDQPSLEHIVGEEISPGPRVISDTDVLQAFQRLGVPGFHACGTCKMGTGNLSVLDERLCVRGVSGLRVVDASAMPTMISGNTNAPVMALAWRAADVMA